MKLSIITINYNNAQELEKTILSVTGQIYKDFEYIVIDGNSTDNSKQLIEKHTDKIDYWISEPDTGIYNAMNKAIKQAKGEYLHFLNSGDYYVSDDVLEKIFANHIYSASIIRGNYIASFGDREEKRINIGNRDVTVYDLYHLALCHQAIFIDRTLFDKYGLYNEELLFVADWEHTLKAILNGETTKYVDIDIAVYDMNGFSSDPKNQDKLLAERTNVLNTLLPKAIHDDYKRFIKLEKRIDHSQHYYISNFVIAFKFPQFIFRVLHKLYTILGLIDKKK